MDISNVRNAVDGCEGEFLSFVLNQCSLSFDNRTPTTAFHVDDSFYADDTVDDMARSDPEGFARCVVDFMSWCGERGHFKAKKDGEQDAIA